MKEVTLSHVNFSKVDRVLFGIVSLGYSEWLLKQERKKIARRLDLMYPNDAPHKVNFKFTRKFSLVPSFNPEERPLMR